MPGWSSEQLERSVPRWFAQLVGEAQQNQRAIQKIDKTNTTGLTENDRIHRTSPARMNGGNNR